MRISDICPTNANNVGYKCWDRLATHVGHCWVMLGIVGRCWAKFDFGQKCWVLLDVVG